MAQHHNKKLDVSFGHVMDGIVIQGMKLGQELAVPSDVREKILIMSNEGGLYPFRAVSLGAKAGNFHMFRLIAWEPLNRTKEE